MEIGNITVHRSLSRDISDIVVSGSLSATIMNMNAISITDRSRTGLTMTARGTVGQLGLKICDRSTKKEERMEAFQVEANEKDGPEDEVESRNSKCGQYDWRMDGESWLLSW